MNTKKKCIVIDDDPLTCDVLAAVMKRRGIECVVVTNGHDAKRRLSEEGSSFAIAIVDLILPHGPTGWDIIDIIRNNPDTSEMRVLVITGAKISADEIERLKQKGCSIILKKDFTVDNFERVLNSLVEAKEK